MSEIATTNNEVILDCEDAIAMYEEDIVKLALSEFVNKTYKVLKENIPIYYVNKNYKDMRTLVHNLKTNSCYMGADKFSELCAEMQHDCEKQNGPGIDKNYVIFMDKLDKLYKEAIGVYKEKFGDDLEVLKENDEKDKDKNDEEFNGLIENDNERSVKDNDIKEENIAKDISKIGLLIPEVDNQKGEISPISPQNLSGEITQGQIYQDKITISEATEYKEKEEQKSIFKNSARKRHEKSKDDSPKEKTQEKVFPKEKITFDLHFSPLSLIQRS